MSKTLREAHQQFTATLKEQGKAHATIIAYSKDIEQLVDFLEQHSVTLAGQVTAEHIDEFKELLKKTALHQ